MSYNDNPPIIFLTITRNHTCIFKLWYVLLRERNIIKTEKYAYWKDGKNYNINVDPEETVAESMYNIKQELSSRKRQAKVLKRGQSSHFYRILLPKFWVEILVERAFFDYRFGEFGSLKKNFEKILLKFLKIMSVKFKDTHPTLINESNLKIFFIYLLKYFL